MKAMAVRILGIERKLKRSVRANSVVANAGTKVAHRVLYCGSEVIPSMWRSCCGWYFASSRYALSSHVAAGHSRCSRCFGDLAGCGSSSSDASVGGVISFE
eukprot:4573658-Amphidinium_carterae.1